MKIVIGVSIGVVVLIVAVIGLVAMVGPKTTGVEGIGTAVLVEPAETGTLIETVTAPGRVEPATNVEISARVSARIKAIPYQEGDHVTKGDPDADPPIPPSVLIQLDSTDLEAQLRSAKARRDGQAAQIEVDKARIEGQEASLLGTKASLDEARRDLDRHREMIASGDVSQSAYEQAQQRFDEMNANYDAAESNLAAAKKALKVLEFNLEAADADIARAEDNLSYTTITSPIDGVVTIVNVEPGELAVTGTMNNPGTVLLEVADLSTMLDVAELDESDVSHVKAGQPAKVRMLAYPDRVFDGTVQSVALSTTQQVTKYFKTEILLKTDEDQIYTGLTADAEIEVARHKDALVIPSQAVLGRPIEDLPIDVREGNDLVDPAKTIATVVYRMIDGKAVVTPVKIGASDVTHTIILAGLKPGDPVVVGPYKVLESIKHDQRIKDQKAEEKPEESKADEASEPEGQAEADTETETQADADTQADTESEPADKADE